MVVAHADMEQRSWCEVCLQFAVCLLGYHDVRSPPWCRADFPGLSRVALFAGLPFSLFNVICGLPVQCRVILVCPTLCGFAVLLRRSRYSLFNQRY